MIGRENGFHFLHRRALQVFDSFVGGTVHEAASQFSGSVFPDIEGQTRARRGEAEVFRELFPQCVFRGRVRGDVRFAFFHFLVQDFPLFPRHFVVCAEAGLQPVEHRIAYALQFGDCCLQVLHVRVVFVGSGVQPLLPLHPSLDQLLTQSQQRWIWNDVRGLFHQFVTVQSFQLFQARLSLDHVDPRMEFLFLQGRRRDKGLGQCGGGGVLRGREGHGEEEEGGGEGEGFIHGWAFLRGFRAARMRRKRAEERRQSRARVLALAPRRSVPRPSMTQERA